jgi:O-antigen biosynthesis protein
MRISTNEHETVTPGIGKRIEIPSSAAPRVSVIIPAAAGTTLLLACLRALALHAPVHIPFETIVVLNNASQSHASELADQFIGVTLISTPVNLGLAGSGNYARAIARGELFILLHDDAEVEAGWMEALVVAADRYADAGAIGGKVLNPDGTLQNAGIILWNDASTSSPWIGSAPPPTAFEHCRAVDYCGTSSLLVRRSTWDAVGGLDEQFFPAYYVDVDLAMGVRALGQCVLYEPASRIRHHRGASTGVRFRHFIIGKNSERFRAKWLNALAAQEPPAPNSFDAINRAMNRCEISRRNGPLIKPEVPTQVLTDEDAKGREMRHLLMERSLWRDFSGALEGAIDGSRPAPTTGKVSRFLDRHILWRFRAWS